MNEILHVIDDETATPNDLPGSQSLMQNLRLSSVSRKYSSASLKEGQSPLTVSINETEMTVLRLSSQQATLLLSSIWHQALSPKNTPQNYAAIAHTYSLLLLFVGSKTSIIEALAPSFQIAFSLMSHSLGGTDSLPPSRRRSLFTLAISMIVFASRAFNVAPLVPICKAMLNDGTMDPFLHLVHENKLQVVKNYTEDSSTSYGSPEDNQNALKYLSAVELTNSCSRESMVFAIMNSIRDLPDLELENIRSQLLRDFSPDDMCPTSAHFLESPGKIARPSSDDDTDYQEAELIDLRNDNNTSAEVSATTLMATAIPVPTPNLLSIDELLETVANDASSQTRAQSTAGDIPFQDMTSHCEALSMGKQHKMSLLMSSKQNKQAAVVVPGNQVNRDEAAHTSVKQNTNPFLQQSMGIGEAQVADDFQQPFLRLPASSPYNNFLKAAGC